MEPNVYLFKEEFMATLKIPKTQWERRKEDLLEWLYNFYDYELLDGKPIRIKINEVIGDYQPLPRKRYFGEDRQQRLENAKKDYELYTIAALGTEFKPNSKAKIAREAMEEFGYDKYSHISQEWVGRKFIKPAFDEHAVTNEKMVWVNYTDYSPMSDSDVEGWRNILIENQMSEEQRANAFDRLMHGEDISKEKQYYKNAVAAFKEKHGYIPIHVKEWRCK